MCDQKLGKAFWVNFTADKNAMKNFIKIQFSEFPGQTYSYEMFTFREIRLASPSGIPFNGILRIVSQSELAKSLSISQSFAT